MQEVNIHYGTSQAGYSKEEIFSVKPSKPGSYNQYPGTVFFHYSIQSATVLERSNTGEELVSTDSMSSSVLLDLNKEFILGQWDCQQEVEQVIGVPFLSQIPILKYLFSTTTVQKENCRLYLSILPRLLNTAEEHQFASGKLFTLEK